MTDSIRPLDLDADHAMRDALILQPEIDQDKFADMTPEDQAFVIGARMVTLSKVITFREDVGRGLLILGTTQKLIDGKEKSVWYQPQEFARQYADQAFGGDHADRFLEGIYFGRHTRASKDKAA